MRPRLVGPGLSTWLRQGPFRQADKKQQSTEAAHYCTKIDLLADYTPLSEVSPGFIKFKISGVVTSIPHEHGNFRKKMWSWLLIVTDPSLEVENDENEETQVKEMKAHLFSNDVDGYPEVHRGDVVFMKQVQCEVSPFGQHPRPVDIRIFSQNDFTVVCCHRELPVEESEPRPKGRQLFPHQLPLAKHLYDWSRRKHEQLPLIFRQLPSLKPPLIGESKEYAPAPSTTFTNFPRIVSLGFKGIPRTYCFYLQVESVEERELTTSSGEHRSAYCAVLTDGGIILPRDLNFAVDAGLDEAEVKTKVLLCVSTHVKTTCGIDLKPGCYYKVSDAHISDCFNASLLSSELLPALEVSRKSKFEEIPESHHVPVLIRERLEKLPDFVAEFKEKWSGALKKLKDGEKLGDKWLME